MDTKKVTTEYRLTQWSQIMQTRQASGQSIKDFCATAGISRNAYFYWQKKLREAACAKLVQQEAVNESALCGWTRIETREVPGGEGVVIEIGDCRVKVTGETEPELLAKVCRILKAL